MIEPQEICPRRVLVIDDTPAIHDDFRLILARDSSGDHSLEQAAADFFGEAKPEGPDIRFELDSALQGQQGVECVRRALAAQRPYALAFVDVRMPPGWDGIETTARIWELDPAVQIVICTAHSDYSWDDMIARLGTSDRLVILKKPFDNIEVLQLANALTEKWRLRRQLNAQLDDLHHVVGERTRQLRESEEHFRLIADNVGDLIAETDTEGHRLYCSPSHERILGFRPEETLEGGFLSRVHPDDLSRVNNATRTCTSTGLQQVLEYRVRHKDGSWRMLESLVSPIRRAGGRVERLVIVARDITARRLAEHEREQMELQLRQAQKLESIGQLAAGIGHEINTPTQYVGDNTRFLRDAFESLTQVLHAYGDLRQAIQTGRVTPELLARLEDRLQTSDLEYLFEQIPAAIRETLEGVDRVTKIVRAMKEFSHPGGQTRAAVDLNKAIESTATVARNEWKYVADLELDLDPRLPAVPCFIGEFNQAILNLLINAAHAIADAVKPQPGTKGRIRIRTRREGNQVEVRVSDTGTGIPEAIQPKIFEPFFTTKEVGKGTGQGLAIVYGSIVKKHGGAVRFETAEGRGTTFILRLPLRAPTAEAPAPAPAATAAPEPTLAVAPPAAQ